LIRQVPRWQTRLPIWGFMKRPTRLVFAGILLLAGRPGVAETQQEVWPGVEALLELGPRARTVLTAGSVRSEEASETGRAVSDLSAECFFDVTLKPILREQFGIDDTDWERRRYLWARFGYHYGTSRGEGSADEHRGVAELTGQVLLPAEVWLGSRGRVERRDTGDTLSTRYRVRLGAGRATRIGRVATVPYLRAEAFYDSRFDAWARWLYQAGAEIRLSERWVFEASINVQEDSEPEVRRVEALGLKLKFQRPRRAATPADTAAMGRLGEVLPYEPIEGGVPDAG
jgi:hypothetical protein